MRAIILIILFGFALFSCNTQATKERKIKKTVTKFWNAVEHKKVSQCVDFVKDGHDYYGGIHMQVSFLNKNYKKINSYINLKENVKIKDTVYVGAKMKYVQYCIKNSKPNYTQKPLLITFIFYDQAGYDKIFNSVFTENFLNWE